MADGDVGAPKWSATGLGADLEAEGGVEGEIGVAAHEGEVFADGGPDEQAVEGVLVVGKAGQAVERGGGFRLQGRDVPTGFGDEARDVIRGNAVEGELAEGGFERDFPKGDGGDMKGVAGVLEGATGGGAELGRGMKGP